MISTGTLTLIRLLTTALLNIILFQESDSLVGFGLSQQNRDNFGLSHQDSASNEVLTDA